MSEYGAVNGTELVDLYALTQGKRELFSPDGLHPNAAGAKVIAEAVFRALCDHPRNLTDDQMRALAAKGGVAQTTIYHGFLKADGEATILDVMAHLDHAIDVMGIDHVGLGTDFDGDGGVRGLADSSELINFTRQLLARRYSEQDIQKIWGGNFMRVMAHVQNSKK